MKIIPFDPTISSYQQFTVNLGDFVCSFRLLWNERDSSWFCDFSTDAGENNSIRLVINSWLIGSFSKLGYDGDFRVLKMDASGENVITSSNFGTVWKLVFGTSDEWSLSMAYNRVAELYVGLFPNGNDPAASGYQIENLHFDFEVKKTIEFYKESARFSIYNANDQTIKEITDGGSCVIFRAGHKDQIVGNIFIGQIGLAFTDDLPNGDTVTTLLCTAQRGAQYPLERNYISFSYPIGTSFFTILRNIADFAGVPLSGANELKSIKLEKEDGPYLDTGNIRDVVENFIKRKLRKLGGFVIISNNEMIYIDTTKKGTELESLILTYSTGLISAKEIRDERSVSLESAFKDNYKYYMGETGEAKKINVPVTTVKTSKSGSVTTTVTETETTIITEKTTVLSSGKIKKKKTVKNKKNKKPDNSQKRVQFECILTPEVSINKPLWINARKSDSDTRSIRGQFYVYEAEFKGTNYGTGGSDFTISGKALSRD